MLQGGNRRRQRQFAETDVSVRYQQVERILGVYLAPETISHLLEPLGIRSVSKNEASIRLVSICSGPM